VLENRLTEDRAWLDAHPRRTEFLRHAHAEEGGAALVLVCRIPNGIHRRMLRELSGAAAAYAHHPERATEAVCEQILAEVSPRPPATDGAGNGVGATEDHG
jgi:hypothetical protein